MKEQAKTIVLALLVTASLVQSYLLAYSEPKFDTIIKSDYVESELAGTRAELPELIMPKDIVLHFGNGEHTVLYPKMLFYQMILEIIVQRTFDGFRMANALDEAAVAASEGEQGIEIRFSGELPLALLEQRMNLKTDMLSDARPVDRIQIYTNPEREEVRVFFTGSQSGAVYESTRADFTAKDVERFVGFGETRTRYTSIAGGHYLPAEPLPMVQYRYSYRRLTADQLQRSLFPDPYNTRNLTERDGSEIYTDGKRGLQLSKEQLWMSYTDPAASSEGEQQPLDTAVSAVQFVNRHGGWNGDYLLANLRSGAGNTEQTVRFLQYVGTYPGSFPVIGANDGLPFGTISMTLRSRNVTGYERSTVQLLGNALERRDVSLPGGEQLMTLWNNFDERSSVLSIFPAYRAKIGEEDVELVPVWALAMADGTVRALPGGGAY